MIYNYLKFLESNGSKYEITKDLDITDLSKMIKSELKEKYPDCKFNIKCERFSMGQSINVSIVDINFNPFTKEALENIKNNVDIINYNNAEKYNEKYVSFIYDVKKITEQYNYDNSDSVTDYSDVRYYTNVHFDCENYLINHHPDYEPTKKIKDRRDYWNEKRNKAKENADKIKTVFNLKKGDLIYYTLKGSKNVPDGEYPGKILKAPNGRSRYYNFYEIEFYVTTHGKPYPGSPLGLRKNTYTTKVQPEQIRKKPDYEIDSEKFGI